MPQFMRASRKAGWTLAVILLLLLVPVAGLLYAVVERSLADLGLATRQAAGVAYLERLSSVYGDLLKGQMSNRNDLSGIREVPSLLVKQHASFVQDASGVTDELIRNWGKSKVGQWRLRALIQDTALHSDLILGNARDRQLLANAVSSQLIDLASTAQGAGTSGSGVTPGEFELLRSAAFAAISEVVKSDPAAKFSKELNEALALMDMRADGFANALESGNAVQTREVAGAFVKSVNALIEVSVSALDQRISDNHDKLSSRLVFVLTLVGLASIVALSVAIRMVGATFRKLDSVEKSETEARAFGEKMQTLNSEVANLNKELSHNFEVLERTQADNISKSNMAQLGSLTAMVAHELRNPLGAVRTSNFLMDKIAKKSAVDLSRHVERVNHAVSRCDSIITQLLNYANCRDANLEQVELSNWLPDLLAAEVNKFPAWLTFVFVDTIGHARMNLDPEKIRQSISNIVANAVQAIAPQGNPQQPGENAITVSLIRRDGGTLIEIADAGPGIPADKIAMVTEPLYTTKSFGPGLGLAYVDRAIRLHNGKLTIYSVVGEGTTVSIWLPGTSALQIAA